MKNFLAILATVIFSLNVAAQDKIYVHTATEDNIDGSNSMIDHPDLNGNPGALFEVAHRYEGVYNNHVTAVTYSDGHWWIMNEDEEPVVEGSKYNIYFSDPDNFFIHTAIGSSGFATDLGSSIGSNEYIFATNLYEGVQNDFVYSTLYDGSHRYIYQPAFLVNIPGGAKFMVLKDGGSNAVAFRHTTSSSNNSYQVTYLDHPLLNGNPDAAFIFMHYSGAPGTTEEYDIDKVLSTWYNSEREQWAIFTEDISTMPEGLVFDILIAPVEEILSVGDYQIQTVAVYPNPTQDNVFFESVEAIQKVTLYDLSGSKIKEFSLNESKAEINLSGLSAGVYLAEIQTAKGSQTVKVVKQ